MPRRRSSFRPSSSKVGTTETASDDSKTSRSSPVLMPDIFGKKWDEVGTKEPETNKITSWLPSRCVRRPEILYKLSGVEYSLPAVGSEVTSPLPDASSAQR